MEVIYEKLRELELYNFEEEKKINKDKDILKLFYYSVVFDKDRQVFRRKVDKYKTLRYITSSKTISSNKHRSYQKVELRNLLIQIQHKRIVEHVFSDNSLDIHDSTTEHNILEVDDRFKPLIYWSKRSRFLRRQIYNALISSILELELNDNFFILKKSKKLLNYYELRLAMVVRNYNVDTDLLADILLEYVDAYNQNKNQFRSIDYSIFKAVQYFKTFAREPKYIDNLILTHKYTSELWENGSKHMHFYTLHNQSHAIELIENINSILKSISFFKISKLDYYILYISCYLHDISMVLYPNYDKFFNNKWEKANEITENHLEKLKKLIGIKTNDYVEIKKHILDLYRYIEDLFENEVRSNHASTSADFIQKSKDLDFIESTIIDHISEVSKGHGMDVRDVYHIKSYGSERKINLKFMMILLRLADLLDMNENRVSIPIFYNNKKNMSLTTKFHWISHLITGDYRFINDYKLTETSDMSYLRPGAISETVTLEIDINIDQLTTVDVHSSKKCVNVTMNDYNGNGCVVLEIKDDEIRCKQDNCNFICRWFNKKNNWLINELSSLQAYLNYVDSYFHTSFQIKLNLNNSTILRGEDFQDLQKYISKDIK